MYMYIAVGDSYVHILISQETGKYMYILSPTGDSYDLLSPTAM